MKKFLSCLFVILSIAFCVCVGCTDKAKSPNQIPKKPDDTTLEFWIAEDVSKVDFSEHYQRFDIMGGRAYYGRGYSPVGMIDGNTDIPPEHCVIYTLSGYPDASDDWNYVTRIEITDPNITVYGLTCFSSLEQFDGVMAQNGYSVEQNSHIFHTAKRGKVSIRLTSTAEHKSLSIMVDVTNKWDADF